MKMLWCVLIVTLISLTGVMCTSTESMTDRPSTQQSHRGPRGMYQPYQDRRGPQIKDLGDVDTYIINLNPEECTVHIENKLNTSSTYREKVNREEKVREITINSVANHAVGEFPNDGNPNSISVHEMSFTIPLNPTIASSITPGQGYESAVLFSGVSIDPFTGEFFVGTDGHMNREWNITTLTKAADLGLDCNNAHVQPTGKYHYHGTPSAYLRDLGADGTQMVKLGYAADGFPLYYKYGYDDNGVIQSYKSGYVLKDGKREGDGVTAPDGFYNGTYFKDYIYDDTMSDLDACNGKWGKTPESDNEYYYLITDNFPSAPLCFSGIPSTDLSKRRGGGPGMGPRGPRGPGQGRPHPPRRGE